MLCVKTTIRPSSIEGVGLFAGESIAKGNIIWRRDFMFDYAYNPGEIEQYPTIIKYVFPVNGQYVLCGDDARFINHSNSPNCTDLVDLGETVATRDIDVGEELTIDYRVYGEPLGFTPAHERSIDDADRGGDAPGSVLDGLHPAAIKAAQDEGGWWKSCSGCHETNEGHSTGAYTYSQIFCCEVGSGCTECGGLGVTWEYYTDQQFAEMAEEAKSSASPPPSQEKSGVRDA